MTKEINSKSLVKSLSVTSPLGSSEFLSFLDCLRDHKRVTMLSRVTNKVTTPNPTVIVLDSHPLMRNRLVH